MNPPSFPQFYILHLVFLSNRKKNNENIKDKSKSDTCRSLQHSQRLKFGIRISAQWRICSIIQGSQFPVWFTGYWALLSEDCPDPFPELSIITSGNECEERQVPSQLNDIGIGFWKSEVGRRNRVHQRENLGADLFPDPSVSLFVCHPF